MKNKTHRDILTQAINNVVSEVCAKFNIPINAYPKVSIGDFKALVLIDGKYVPGSTLWHYAHGVITKVTVNKNQSIRNGNLDTLVVKTPLCIASWSKINLWNTQVEAEAAAMSYTKERLNLTMDAMSGLLAYFEKKVSNETKKEEKENQDSICPSSAGHD